MNDSKIGPLSVGGDLAELEKWMRSQSTSGKIVTASLIKPDPLHPVMWSALVCSTGLWFMEDLNPVASPTPGQPPVNSPLAVAYHGFFTQASVSSHLVKLGLQGRNNPVEIVVKYGGPVTLYPEGDTTRPIVLKNNQAPFPIPVHGPNPDKWWTWSFSSSLVRIHAVISHKHLKPRVTSFDCPPGGYPGGFEN